jgi:hypothetical protein
MWNIGVGVGRYLVYVEYSMMCGYMVQDIWSVELKCMYKYYKHIYIRVYKVYIKV